MSTFTPERIVGAVAALAALAGVVAGVLALSRPAPRSLIALVAGLFGIIVGGLVVVTADGGPGTGNGIVGGWVALALGLIAIALGGVARSRARVTGG